MDILPQISPMGFRDGSLWASSYELVVSSSFWCTNPAWRKYWLVTIFRTLSLPDITHKPSALHVNLRLTFLCGSSFSQCYFGWHRPSLSFQDCRWSEELQNTLQWNLLRPWRLKRNILEQCNCQRVSYIYYFYQAFDYLPCTRARTARWLDSSFYDSERAQRMPEKIWSRRQATTDVVQRSNWCGCKQKLQIPSGRWRPRFPSRQREVLQHASAYWEGVSETQCVVPHSAELDP